MMTKRRVASFFAIRIVLHAISLVMHISHFIAFVDERSSAVNEVVNLILWGSAKGVS